MPRFSVLIPTHDRAEVLGPAIASVLSQTLQDFEVLVVGDGCADASAEVVAGFGDSRIRWFDFPKAPGFGYANRNLALQQATGDLIAFLGHDNLYFPDHLARLSVPFQNQRVMMAYSRPLWIRDDGVILPFFVNLNTAQARQSFMKQRNILPATTVVYRRSLHDEVGCWPEDVPDAGDWALWKRILTAYPKGLGFCRVPTCLHFRANWRAVQKWGPPAVSYLSYLKDEGTFWESGLDLKLNQGGDLPQTQVAAMLAQGGSDLVARIRTGVENLADILAWNASLDTNLA